MACWVLSGNFSAKWAVLRKNKVALLSLALFGLLILGMSWSVESFAASGRCLLKYRELIYLPMFVVVFQEVRLRTLATSAFMAAAVLLLGLSYFEWMSHVDMGVAAHPLDLSPVISKDRIIHSLLMAFLAYLAALRLAAVSQETAAGEVSSRYWQWLYGAVLGLAIFNVLFMVEGRTGYLVLGALTMLFLLERLGRRGVIIACLLVGGGAWAGVTFSGTVRARIAQTVSQIENQFGPQRKHSADPRLEFYENTLKLIRRHPVLGTGTGSFHAEYTRLIANTDDRPTSDPHNEYLHLACQVGIGGPLLFVALLVLQWFAAGRLPAAEKHIGRGIVLTIALGSLFNSLILSVTGGVIYAYFSGVAFAGLLQPREAEAFDLPQDQTTDAPQAVRRSAA
ncbi:MAG: O-antigen ligase family protein [Deltaproteobacteria bacterium]